MFANDLKFTLHSGDEIPMVGLGTSGITGKSLAKEVLDFALEAGYRLIDTSPMYGNESDIGKALKEVLQKHGLTRKDVFISTKLHPDDHGDRAVKAIHKSLQKLQCEYIDLYMINWPGAYGVSTSSKENVVLRDKSWQHMVKAVQEGLIRNIGVSSYTPRHMKQLLQNNHGIKPSVNQIEWHPFCHDKKIYELCQKENILVQAYQSLGGPDNNDLLEHSDVVRIAKMLDKQPAQISLACFQVLLRWALQQNVSVIPKSKTKARIFANMELKFTIPESDMKVLSNFKKKIRYDWDPEQIV
ncbi:unnamed protein product [Phaedon cochleariae]|uniref:NADP-dependent oxidoreductase domain-containing protein n=1 Tax=Phaedon cochleariae TaxID=80249 RepID=A0A9P0DB81_PHACE|nr:unnamed protein product [Phaedon cochleariae]